MKTFRLIPMLAALGACDDEVFPTPPSPPSPPDGPTGPVGEGWCGVSALFERECVVCHSAALATGELDLETDPHAAIVGVTSAAYGEILVDPGDPDGSLLLAKISGTQGAEQGVAMPPNRPLDADTIAVVRRWIEDGADAACTTPTDPTDSGTDTGTADYHPEGFGVAEVHGLAAKLRQDDCQACHGQGFPADGGTSGISCGGCHDAVVPDWTTTCTFCHGDPAEGSGAPPQDIDDDTDPTTISFPAHLAHVQQTELHRPFDCTECHRKPTDVFSPGHVFEGDDTVGVAEVRFDGGVAVGGTYASATCEVYCHSDAQGNEIPVTTTQGDIVCGGCHGVATHWADMSGKHQSHLISTPDDITCSECHSTAAVPTAEERWAIADFDQHINGSVQVDLPKPMTRDGDSCDGSCHGFPHVMSSWSP